MVRKALVIATSKILLAGYKRKLIKEGMRDTDVQVFLYDRTSYVDITKLIAHMQGSDHDVYVLLLACGQSYLWLRKPNEVPEFQGTQMLADALAMGVQASGTLSHERVHWVVCPTTEEERRALKNTTQEVLKGMCYNCGRLEYWGDYSQRVAPLLDENVIDLSIHGSNAEVYEPAPDSWGCQGCLRLLRGLALFACGLLALVYLLSLRTSLASTKAVPPSTPALAKSSNVSDANIMEELGKLNHELEEVNVSLGNRMQALVRDETATQNRSISAVQTRVGELARMVNQSLGQDDHLKLKRVTALKGVEGKLDHEVGLLGNAVNSLRQLDPSKGGESGSAWPRSLAVVVVFGVALLFLQLMQFVATCALCCGLGSSQQGSEMQQLQRASQESLRQPLLREAPPSGSHGGRRA